MVDDLIDRDDVSGASLKISPSRTEIVALQKLDCVLVLT